MVKVPSSNRIKLNFKQTMDILLPYIKNKIVEQLKAVALIVLYLILFQLLILRIPISEAVTISIGVGLVIFGLAFFMEGLMLGIMPLGETCGLKIPQKLKLPAIIVFAFLLGFLATFAEPAIGILQQAGFSVKAWNAPLLFLLLNKYSLYLKMAVGVGVGLAVIIGMLRFLYRWSLKVLLYIIIPVLLGITLYAYFDPNLVFLTGLAWDCGGVTTGPVTVPLVLALGIGISRIIGGESSGVSSGFGVVTLASALPVFTVMLLGMLFLGSVPKPVNDIDFFKAENKAKVQVIFKDANDMTGYVLKNASEAAQLAYFEGDKKKRLELIGSLVTDTAKRVAVFGTDPAFSQWVMKGAPSSLRLEVYGLSPSMQKDIEKLSIVTTGNVNAGDVIKRNSLSAVQAIFLLCSLLFIMVLIILREKLPKPDEIILGVVFAVIGMSLFNIGIELGLTKLGNQSGMSVTSSFKAVALEDQRKVLRNFDTGLIQKAVTPDGSTYEFFYSKSKDNTSIRSLPFDESQYDKKLKEYIFTPKRGPLFGSEFGFWGILVVLLFGFFLGYGATMAEPALNALGITVEELSVGTFKKSMLMQAVAIGVGIGIAVGVAKIIWNLPLVWLLIPPYVLLLFLTAFSTEDFVNIGWDSAGVTTGPITVPLVLAMGLGISGQMGVVEGFGILAMASAYPILCVLIMGLYVNAKRSRALKEATQEAK
jgi:hypothetical protein